MYNMAMNHWKYRGAALTEAPEGAYGFLYLIRFPNGMLYIGQRKFRQGWRSYCGGGKLVKAYLKKHGRANPQKMVLMVFDDPDALDKAETHLIRLVGAVKSKKYYNLVETTTAGGRGQAVSDERRAKMSAMYKGIPRPQWVRDKISASSKGKKISAEARQNMSKSQMGRKAHNAERIIVNECIIFNSACQMSEILGYSRISIRKWLRGTRTPSKRFGISSIRKARGDE